MLNTFICVNLGANLGNDSIGYDLEGIELLFLIKKVMISNMRFNLLIALFPIVYLIHNCEEWFLFSQNVNTIAELSPSLIRGYAVENTTALVTIFSIGLIIATLIPFVVAIIIWNKPTLFNIKILVVIAFATLINGFSHVSSSLVLGIIGPGLITGVLICIPFSSLVIIRVHKNHRFTLKEYSLLGLLAIIVYVLAIALSWFIGYEVYRILS